MNPKTKNFLFFFIGAFAAMLLMYFFSNGNTERKSRNSGILETSSLPYENSGKVSENTSSDNIKALTEENRVIRYIKTNRKLPDYYLTKNEAKKRGWDPSEGNLCDVLPGHAIGGDHFGNRERKLPKGARYYEADVNYDCGKRDADRIVFDEYGNVWLSHDHYRTFEKK